MKRMRKFTVSSGDGSITGTVTITEDKPGQATATGDWSVPKDSPRADEECDALLEDIFRTVLAEDGMVGAWSSAKRASAIRGS